jgi:hypothetical protein
LGFVLFYIGVTITEDSEGHPDSWLERKSKAIRERGEGVLELQAAFLRAMCEKFASWFDTRFYRSGFMKFPVTICAIPNALVFLIFPRLWEPSMVTKILFALAFLWCAVEGSTFEILLISSFPFIFRWWEWFQPLRSGTTRSELVSDVKFLLAEILIVFGIFLAGALAILLFLGINRLLAGLAQRAKNPLIYLSILLPVNGIVAALSFLPLLRPDLTFPSTWLSLDTEAFHWIAVQALLFSSLLIVLPALTCLVIILLMLIPLMHQILWPLLWKSLHKLNRRLVDFPALFVGAGLSCMCLAWPSSPFVKVLRHIGSYI